MLWANPHRNAVLDNRVEITFLAGHGHRVREIVTGKNVTNELRGASKETSALPGRTFVVS
ncbi:hypothetical protein PG994_001814 [Apiospora phragmitis]|uniref:Uncharacterized protein n=1 Tax=Apiospora phragmitis TaxID=2905665 RepID=A0ABR1WUN4_9PEZI